MEGATLEYHGIENDVKFIELALFAVNEHNKKENAVLKFAKVLSAKQHLVSSTQYFITMEVIDGGKKSIYEATIWNVPWLKSRQLENFKLIGDSPSV